MTYVVDEEDENCDGSVLEVCLQVSGDLDRDVDVYVTTTSQAALGETGRQNNPYITSQCLHISLIIYPAANVDYSVILAELRALKFKFQRKRSVVSITEEQCFNVTILSDVLVEDDEVFFVQLSTDDGGVVLSPEQADVVIIDNDCKYSIH